MKWNLIELWYCQLICTRSAVANYDCVFNAVLELIRVYSTVYSY